jgi:hypothetical protein
MNEKNLSQEDVKELRTRVEYEDQLLNSRLNIVLTLNGLMAVAASFSLPAAVRILTAIIIIIVDALWIVCSLDAQHFIYTLTTKILESGNAPIGEVVRKDAQQNRLRLGSTRFMTLVIPSLLLSGWVLSLILVGIFYLYEKVTESVVCF